MIKDGMFFEKYQTTVEEKKSIININLDPALPSQRKNFVIPNKYLVGDDSDTLLNFSLDTIENVSDYCCSIKPNLQYFLSDTKLLRKIVARIHDEGMIAILDHKLNDISSTNDSAVYWISEMKFDAFTFSPFVGNMKAVIENAHVKDLGVIVWTLMSNAEAEKIIIETKVDGIPFYQSIANEVKERNADGCVVGLTGFIKKEYIRTIQNTIGENKVFLFQGIGPQGGNEVDLEKVKIVANPLVSLGREVIFSENVKESVKRYCDLLNKVRKT